MEIDKSFEINVRINSLNKALEAKMSGLEVDDVLSIAKKYYEYTIGVI